MHSCSKCKNYKFLFFFNLAISLITFLLMYFLPIKLITNVFFVGMIMSWLLLVVLYVEHTRKRSSNILDDLQKLLIAFGRLKK